MSYNLRDLPESWKTYYGMLGMLTSAWSFLEYTLGCIVAPVHADYGGDQIEPEMPRSFNTKPPYLRKAFAAHPELQQHRERLTEILTEASELADLRHWCIHGIYKEIPENGAMEIAKIIRGVNSRVDRRKMTFDDIDMAITRTMVLSINAMFFGIESVRIIPKDQAEDVVRKLLSEQGAVLPAGKLFG